MSKSILDLETEIKPTLVHANALRELAGADEIKAGIDLASEANSKAGMAQVDAKHALKNTPSSKYWLHINGDTTLMGETKVFDKSLSLNDFVAGDNLSSAQMLATPRFISTIEPTATEKDSVLRSPPLGFDYENNESLLIFFKGCITPPIGGNQIFMGDTFSTTTPGISFRVRPTGQVDMFFGAVAGGLFAGPTIGLFNATTPNSFAMLINGVNKTYRWYYNAAPENNELSLASGVNRDTVSSDTFNIGAGSAYPGGSAGAEVKVNTFAIFRSATPFGLTEVDAVIAELQGDGTKLIGDSL